MNESTFKKYLRELVKEVVKEEFENFLIEMTKSKLTPTAKPAQPKQSVYKEDRSRLNELFKPNSAHITTVNELLKETPYDPTFGEEIPSDPNTDVFVKDYSQLMEKIENKK